MSLHCYTCGDVFLLFSLDILNFRFLCCAIIFSLNLQGLSLFALLGFMQTPTPINKSITCSSGREKMVFTVICQVQ